MYSFISLSSTTCSNGSYSKLGSSSMFGIGIIGDPEGPILRLVTGSRPRSIPGVVYWHRETLVVNPKVDLRKFPVPAYHLWHVAGWYRADYPAA